MNGEAGLKSRALPPCSFKGLFIYMVSQPRGMPGEEHPLVLQSAAGHPCAKEELRQSPSRGGKERKARPKKFVIPALSHIPSLLTWGLTRFAVTGDASDSL